MIEFGIWLLAGVVIGMILMAFLAVGTFQRGYEEGYRLRRPWRAELGARRGALATASLRETAAAASASRARRPAPAAVPHPVAASTG